MGEHGASDGDGGTQPKEKQGVDDAVPDKICEFVREQLPPEKIQKIAHDAVGRLVQEGVAEWVTEERVGTELKTAINEATRQASEDQQIQDDLICNVAR